MSNNWPKPEYWQQLNNYDLETAWDDYLSSPEYKVADELKLLFEPSIQAGFGSMFIFPQDGSKYMGEGDGCYDFEKWCEREIEMASDSSSPEEYEAKFREFIISIMEA